MKTVFGQIAAMGAIVVAALLAAQPLLFQGVQYLGAAYLAWIGLKLIFALGLISLERYQDLEAYLKIRDKIVRLQLAPGDVIREDGWALRWLIHNPALFEGQNVLELLFKCDAWVQAVVLPKLNFLNSQSSRGCLGGSQEIVEAGIPAPLLARFSGDSRLGCDDNICLLLLGPGPGS